MSHNFEGKQVYRLFNIVLFVLYSFVFLVSILAGVVGYGERRVTSATVKCRDGTSWNAKDFYYNSYALCGICTKRTPDGKSYKECNWEDVDYSSYQIKIVKEPWSWSTIIYPSIVIILGFGLVDFLRIALFYIFTGRVSAERSLLYVIFLIINGGYLNYLYKKRSQAIDVEVSKLFPYLLKIKSRDVITEIIALDYDMDYQLEDSSKRLEELYRKTGKEEKYFDNKDSFNMDIKTLKEQKDLKIKRDEAQIYRDLITRLMGMMASLNHKLDKGMSLEKAASELQREEKKARNEFIKRMTAFSLYLAGSEEIIKARQQGLDRDKAKINTDNLKERASEYLSLQIDRVNRLVTLKS